MRTKSSRIVVTSIAGSRSNQGLVQVPPVAPEARSKDPPFSRGDTATLLGLVSAAGAFYLLPWPPAYAVALIAVGALSFYRLDLALILIPLFAPFFMVPKHVGNKEFGPQEVFILIDVLVFITWLVRPGKHGRPRFGDLRDSPFLRPLLLLLFAGVLSTALSADRHLALAAFRLRVLEPMMYFALLILVLDRRRLWQLQIVGVVLAGVLLSAIGFAQLVTHQDLSYAPGSALPRLQALYGSPDNLGLFLDRVVPLALAIAIAGQTLPRFRKIGYLLIAPLVATLVLTYSRGAWLAVGVSCFGLLSLQMRGFWKIAVLVLLLGGVALGIKGPAVTRAFGSGHTGTVQRRLDVWRSAVHMVRDHPLLGIGPDNFLHYYAPVHQLYSPCAGLGYMQPEAADEPCLSHPHNEFLDFWLSTGVLGLGAFAWLQFAFWRSSLSIWNKGRDRFATPMLLGVMAAMLASLLHGLVDNVYFLPDLALLFWLLCAFVSFESRYSSDIAGEL
jgi:putative inorganic carbon (hco3(-)) transporter